MKKGLLRLVLLGLCMTPSPAAPPESGWTPLFNGKDLTGWRVHGQERWAVEDGMIVAQSTTGKYGYLMTEKNYNDFRLRLRFQGEPGGNSGVFLHARMVGEGADGPDITAMQVEVEPGPGMHTGGLYESGGRAWVLKPTPEGEQALKVREWNDLEIAIEGRHIVTRLNGVQIVDFYDPAPRFTAGGIALQVHTGGGVKMRFKDISIQEIGK